MQTCMRRGRGGGREGGREQESKRERERERVILRPGLDPECVPESVGQPSSTAWFFSDVFAGDWLSASSLILSKLTEGRNPLLGWCVSKTVEIKESRYSSTLMSTTFT